MSPESPSILCLYLIAIEVHLEVEDLAQNKSSSVSVSIVLLISSLEGVLEGKVLIKGLN